MTKEDEIDNTTWCEYCSERAATTATTVTTADGSRSIAVCQPCLASINENGYAGVEYAPEPELREVNEDYE